MEYWSISVWKSIIRLPYVVYSMAADDLAMRPRHRQGAPFFLNIPASLSRGLNVKPVN